MSDVLFNSLGWMLLAVFGLYSAGHALLNKRDPRSALGWIVTTLAMPGVGPILYWLFGVNRIRTRARGWQHGGTGLRHRPSHDSPWARSLIATLPPSRRDNFIAHIALADAVTRRPLVGQNRLVPLFNGEQAYPEMLAAIEAAQQCVCLSTYIFDSDRTGRDFVAALARPLEG